MNCRQARRLLPEYLENSLTGPESSALRDHLAACPNCGSEERQLRAALSFIRLANPPGVPRSLRESVLRQIEREGTTRGRFNRAMKYSSFAAAAAVFVLLLAGNLLLTVLPLSRQPAAASDQGTQVRTMLSEAPPQDTYSSQREEVRLTAEAVQAEDADAKTEYLSGRPPVIWRLLLNISLVPLFIVLFWRAVKKGRVV